MNGLRRGRCSDRAAVINEPGSFRFQGAVLPAKDLRRSSQDHPLNLINDWQSLIKRCSDLSDGCSREGEKRLAKCDRGR